MNITGNCKPISREVLARCVELEIRDFELAEKIRADDSFDFAEVSSMEIGGMQVRLVKAKEAVPVFETYCGHAVEKTLKKLGYAPGYRFPFTIHLA